MKKRLGSLLMCLALLLALLPGSRAADNVALTVEIRGSGTVQMGDNEPAASTDTKYFAPGTTVTLKAVPAEGYRMAFWFDGTSSNWTGTPGSRELTVTLSADTTCVAEFLPTSMSIGAEWVLEEDTDLRQDQNGYLLDCGAASVGYDLQPWKTVRVKNTSEEYIKLYDSALFRFTAAGGQDAADWFECSTYSYTMIAPNASAYILVRPKTGLPEGTYTAEMAPQEVCDPGIDPPLTAAVTFRVTTDPVVSLSVSPAAGGTVTGGGVYKAGEKATLTATPNPRYRFRQWSDGDTSNPRTLTVTEPVTLTAEFEQTEAVLSLEIRGDGSVQVGDFGTLSETGDIAVPVNTEFILKATPAKGYRMAFWFDGTYSQWTGTPGSRELAATLSADAKYVAEFLPTSMSFGAEWVLKEDTDLRLDQNGYLLDCGAASVGYDRQPWKTVCVKNVSEEYIKLYDSALFRFTTAGGQDAADWFECSTYSNTMLFPNASAYLMIRPKTGLPAGTYSAEMTLQEVCDPGIDPPLTAAVTFKVTKNCVITARVDGDKGGTVTGAGAYEAGQTVTLTAKPDTNYAFDHWERGDGSTSTANPLTFRVEEAETVTAFFRRTGYTVSVSADPAEGGSVTLKYADGSAAVNGGSYPDKTQLTAVAVPKAGYVFAGWTDNGRAAASDAGKPGTLTVTANPDHALIARFAPYSVSGGRVSAPKGSVVILAEYDGGRMIGLHYLALTEDCGDADARTLFRLSEYPNRFKLILMNGKSFAPVCEAWG